MNGNGYLSLAEIDKAIRDVIKAPALFKSKPAVMRAFQAARRANGVNEGAKGAYVERSEFRLLLEYLKLYFELYAGFRRIDASDDRRIDLHEWRKGVALLSRWGIRLSQQEADDEFRRCDVNSGGAILFDEFCDFAIDRKLQLDGGEGAATRRTPLPSPREGASNPAFGRAAKGERPTAQMHVASPRPTSAQEAPGVIGWRGGGTRTLAKSGMIDPTLLAMKQQALDAVASKAAAAFSKAKPTQLPRPDEARIARKQAIAMVGMNAKAKLGRSLSRDEQEERAWSAQNRKASPAMTQIVTAPPQRHIPSDSDHRMGARSDKALAHDFGPPNFQLTGGRKSIDPAALKNIIGPARGHDGCGPTDVRMWRCTRCRTMIPAGVEHCTACTQARSPAKARSAALSKPAGWTPI